MNYFYKVKLCDLHLNKMLVEHTQVLSTVQRHYGYDVGYKPTHINHPVCVWARLSIRNYYWLYRATHRMHEDRAERWPDKPKHKSIHQLDDLCIAPPAHLFPVDKWTVPPMCMPDEYMTDNVAESYRRYYTAKLQDFLDRGLDIGYTNTEPPTWLPDHLRITKEV